MIGRRVENRHSSIFLLEKAKRGRYYIDRGMGLLLTGTPYRFNVVLLNPAFHGATLGATLKLCKE